jgi:hypothetical protein
MNRFSYGPLLTVLGLAFGLAAEGVAEIGSFTVIDYPDAKSTTAVETAGLPRSIIRARITLRRTG